MATSKRHWPWYDMDRYEDDSDESDEDLELNDKNYGI